MRDAAGDTARETATNQAAERCLPEKRAPWRCGLLTMELALLVLLVAVIAGLGLHGLRPYPAPPSGAGPSAAARWRGLGSPALKAELHAFAAQSHAPLAYKEVWAALEAVDRGVDIYTGARWPVGEAAGARCGFAGSPQRSGQCFNREHAWPKSWWGGFKEGGAASTDLYALFLVDGHVNHLRGDLPFGMVNDSVAVFRNSEGAKRGPCQGASKSARGAGTRCACRADAANLARLV